MRSELGIKGCARLARATGLRVVRAWVRGGTQHGVLAQVEELGGVVEYVVERDGHRVIGWRRCGEQTGEGALYDQVMQGTALPEVIVTSPAGVVHVLMERGMTAAAAEAFVAMVPQEESGCAGE